jgi:hypothetical protein
VANTPRPLDPRAWIPSLLVLALAAAFAWRDETSLDLGFHVASETEARYRWNFAIVPYSSGGLLRAMHDDSTWALIGVDGVSALLVRNTAEHRALIDSAWTAMGQANAPAPADGERLAPSPLAPAIARWFVRRPFPFEAWGRGNGYAVFA